MTTQNNFSDSTQNSKRPLTEHDHTHGHEDGCCECHQDPKLHISYGRGSDIIHTAYGAIQFNDPDTSSAFEHYCQIRAQLKRSDLPPTLLDLSRSVTRLFAQNSELPDHIINDLEFLQESELEPKILITSAFIKKPSEDFKPFSAAQEAFLELCAELHDAGIDPRKVIFSYSIPTLDLGENPFPWGTLLAFVLGATSVQEQQHLAVAGISTKQPENCSNTQLFFTISAQLTAPQTTTCGKPVNNPGAQTILSKKKETCKDELAVKCETIRTLSSKPFSLINTHEVKRYERTIYANIC